MRLPSYLHEGDNIQLVVLLAYLVVGNIVAWWYALTTDFVYDGPLGAILATPEWLAVMSVITALLAVQFHREMVLRGSDSP